MQTDNPVQNDTNLPRKPQTGRKLVKSTAILLLLLGIAIIFATGVGAVSISPMHVWKVIINHIPGINSFVHYDISSSDSDIVWQFRFPRVILAALVGICLAMAGTSLQGLLLNPLADPYMIGVSSGASVGAGIAVMLRYQNLFMGFGVPLFAFIAALITVTIVYALARRNGQVSVLSFILAGVVVGAFMWAALTFILSLGQSNLEEIIFWTMGSLGGLDSWRRVFTLAPFTIVGFIILYSFSRDLNIFALGEESARYLGLDVESLKRIIIVLVTLITAAAVSVSGTIGFVGLMVPHMTRRIVGPDHRILIPCAALLGAVFMITADAIARTVMRPSEIPIGVITALLGAPFFLYLLRKSE
ncbi:MAG: FecCD family ABC transporter permease [Armatimonadota bacterium]